MTVQELIDFLQKVKDKEKIVIFASLNTIDYTPIEGADETDEKMVLWGE